MTHITHALRLAFALVLLATPAAAQTETISGPFEAGYVSCHDGDTCRFDIHVWIGHTVHTAVRLRGVDAPEIRGRCDAERTHAIAAREFMRALLASATTVRVSNVEPDKYGGRVVADIAIDGRSAAELLIDADLGRPYDAGARQSWCRE